MAQERNSPTADRELYITKLVDAPLSLVTKEDLEQTVRIFKADEGLRQTTERMAAYARLHNIIISGDISSYFDPEF